jgi:CheY-like chemotaxis protein
MGNLQILVVDDELISRKMNEARLISRGYQISLAANGSEAIAALQKENFDLVITDLEMGDPDGYAVLKKVKDLNPLTQCIEITGNHDTPSALKAIRVGVEDYLSKPFHPSELLDCVKKSANKLELNEQGVPKDAECSSSEEQIYDIMQTMSSDLKSALISMSTRLKFLKRGEFGEMPKEIVDELEKLSSRCGKLTTMAEKYLDNIYSLKNNTKIEKQKLNLLDDIIMPVLDELFVDTDENSVAVDNSEAIPLEKISVNGDRGQLNTVFRNLFQNAIKNGGRGCSLGADRENQLDHYRFAVFNNGPAIPECSCRWVDR